MNRREFLAGGVAVGCATAVSAAGCACSPCAGGCPKPLSLDLSLQWNAIPVPQDSIAARLDYLEANGYAAFETPTGKWLLDNGEKLADALKGRRLRVATACGPSDFSWADKSKRDAEVGKFLPQLEVLGALKSVGLIVCPARSKPELPLKELRESFVEDTGRRLAEKAAACGTTIVLEPLQRRETPFLRQVSDGAKMAQEIGAGATVMADFWHMSKEEVNFFGPIVTAGKLLSHVHIASLKARRIPGLDGAADDYRDGFKGLKFIGYTGAVSLEGGWPSKGKDAKGKPILPPLPERHELLVRMCGLLRRQWAEA